MTDTIKAALNGASRVEIVNEKENLAPAGVINKNMMKAKGIFCLLQHDQ